MILLEPVPTLNQRKSFLSQVRDKDEDEVDGRKKLAFSDIRLRDRNINESNEFYQLKFLVH